VVVDLLDLFTQPKLIEIVIQEQEPVAFLARDSSRMTHPVQQCAGDSLDLCMAICFLLCSRPCQMVTSNFRALATRAFCLPMRAAKRSNWAWKSRVMFDRHPGCLNHDSPQITASFLGDTTASIGCPRLVDTCSQASIAHQMFGRGEAADLPNSGQATHGGEDSHPRQLHQERNLVDPRVKGAKADRVLLRSPE
jgi:hypothetical protein